MMCHDLANRIQQLQPEAQPKDVARLCLLLANEIDNFDRLGEDKELRNIWMSTGLKLKAATDQHAAMTEELESLAASDPRKFTPEQIWVLIRAIKVQSQILQMYVGETALDV
jgi:hypothetical protein